MSEAGILERTVECAFIEREQALRAGIRPTPGVVLLDEAGTLGTQALWRLAHAARCAEARLMLVGDDAQLPPVPAGSDYADRAAAEAASSATLLRGYKVAAMAVTAPFHGGPLDRRLYVLGQSRPPDTITAQRTLVGGDSTWAPAACAPPALLAAPSRYATTPELHRGHATQARSCDATK